jgi:histidine triad (HIT) family protein
MKPCIFCKIVDGKLPSSKIYEDKDYLAIMDVFPSASHQFLVIPKKHTTSKFTDVPDKVLSGAILVAKKVAKHVDSKIGTRGCISIEGFQVPHLHVVVYPVKKGKYLVDYYRGGTSKADTKKLAEQAAFLKL